MVAGNGGTYYIDATYREVQLVVATRKSSQVYMHEVQYKFTVQLKQRIRVFLYILTRC